MAATYVTANELRSVLGVGTLYPDSDLELACQTAEDTLNQYLWFDSYPVIGCTVVSNKCTLVLSAPATFTVGQTITVSGVGTSYNGSRTITATYPWTNGLGTFRYLHTFSLIHTRHFLKDIHWFNLMLPARSQMRTIVK